jgi:hypothetical protein
MNTPSALLSKIPKMMLRSAELQRGGFDVTITVWTPFQRYAMLLSRILSLLFPITISGFDGCTLYILVMG